MNLSFINKVYARVEIDAGAGGGGGSDEGVSLGDKLTLGIGGDSVNEVYETPSDLISLIVANLMWIGGLILFFMIILAGFKFLQDTTKGKEEAMKILKSALIGFILMFSAFWIVQIVKVITGTQILL